jgi:hypothetical protein
MGVMCITHPGPKELVCRLKKSGSLPTLLVKKSASCQMVFSGGFRFQQWGEGNLPGGVLNINKAAGHDVPGGFIR